MRVLHPLATGLSAELESAGIYKDKDHIPLATRELVPLTTPFRLVKKTGCAVALGMLGVLLGMVGMPLGIIEMLQGMVGCFWACLG